MKRIVIIFGLVTACVIVSLELTRQRASQPVATRNMETTGNKAPPVALPTEVASVREKEVITPPANTAKAEPNTNVSAQPQNTPDPGFMYNGYQIQDPMARVALSLVGADSEAEQYWLNAVNDPDVPSEERKDLIEDLNETGLADPRHPTPADLALIAQRLTLVEQLQSWPIMDNVNRDALIEVERDLIDLMQGKEPQ